jgi:peptidoglycan/LPS O-acetylase OafA/YrhL
MLRNNFLDHHNAAIFGYKYSDFINIVLALLTIPYVANNVNQKYAVHMKHDALYASMSFIIYLLHWPMFKIYGVYTSNLNSVLYKSMSLITLYLLCLLFTWILSRYFDTSVDEGRRSWLKKQPLEATKKNY